MNLYRIYRFGVIKQNQFFLLAHLIFNFRKLVTFIDIISRTLRLFWEVELRRKFWILFKLQNYFSGVAVETGILQKIFNRFYTLDYLIRDEIKLDDYCQYLNGFFSNCTTTISVWEISFNTSGIYKSSEEKCGNPDWTNYILYIGHIWCKIFDVIWIHIH